MKLARKLAKARRWLDSLPSPKTARQFHSVEASESVEEMRHAFLRLRARGASVELAAGAAHVPLLQAELWERRLFTDAEVEQALLAGELDDLATFKPPEARVFKSDTVGNQETDNEMLDVDNEMAEVEDTDDRNLIHVNRGMPDGQPAKFAKKARVGKKAKPAPTPDHLGDAMRALDDIGYGRSLPLTDPDRASIL